MNAVFPRTARVHDFWRVNSYGYPCFFSDSDKAQEAWNTLLSFYEFTDYDALKKYWSSNDSPRRLSSHAVESWKATFEEFGLLYVESRSNTITITPAGEQIRNAADSDNQAEFAWIGINLLLRYPLRGPRRPKSEEHRDSDLLLYRFFYSSLIDLDCYIWWTELERILCRVFYTNDTIDAIEDVKILRANPEFISRIDLPAAQRQGAFYNSLNQVAVHAGMNHLLLETEDSDCPYGVTEPKRKHRIRRNWLGMIRKALSNSGGMDQCAAGASAIARLASAPALSSEAEYFSYLGAKVAPLASAVPATISSFEFQGERVSLLVLDTHYSFESAGLIFGSVTVLCQLAKGQRLILSHDENWTYLIEDKQLIDANSVRIKIRRGRPISNASVLRELQEEEQ